jgi:hypothetical protein
MDAVLISYFFLITGVLVPGFISVAVRPPQPAGVKTGPRTERRR